MTSPSLEGRAATYVVAARRAFSMTWSCGADGSVSRASFKTRRAFSYWRWRSPAPSFVRFWAVRITAGQGFFPEWARWQTVHWFWPGVGAPGPVLGAAVLPRPVVGPAEVDIKTLVTSAMALLILLFQNASADWFRMYM